MFKRGKSIVHAMSGSKITVQGQLYINNALLHGCNEWEGIAVSLGGQLYVNQNNSNPYISTTIRDATYGIYLHKNSTAIVNKTKLYNNNWGIFAPDEGYPTATKLNIISTIFDGESKSNSAVGMEVYNLPHTMIRGILASFLISLTEFKNLSYGVKSYNSHLEFDYSVFYNIINTGIQSLPNAGLSQLSRIDVNNLFLNEPTSYVTFSNLKTCIFVLNTDLEVNGAIAMDVDKGIQIDSRYLYHTLINKCHFTARESCLSVQAKAGSEGRVYDNTFITDAGSNNNNQQSYITMKFLAPFNLKSGSWDVQENEIINNTSGNCISAFNMEYLNISKNLQITANNTVAPNVIIRGGFSNKITCNEYIDGGTTGILINNSDYGVISNNCSIYANNSGLVFNNLCEGTDVKGNVLNGANGYSMYYSTSPNYYTLTKEQLNAGNCFNGTVISGKQVKHGYPHEVVVLMSQHFVEDINCHNPGEEAITNSWIEENQSFDPECSPTPNQNNCYGGGIPFVDPDLGNRIVNGDLGFHYVIANIDYSLKERLYRRLLEELPLPSEYESFIDDMNTTNIKLIYDILTEISGIITFNVNEKATYNFNIGIISALKLSLDNYFSTTEEIDFSDIEQWLQDIRNAEDELTIIEDSRTSRFNSNISYIINSVNDLAPQNPIEENYKNFLLVYLYHLINVNTPLSTTQQQTLQNIANQCLLYGGSPVLYSRGLLDILGLAITYDDDILCTPPQPLINKLGDSDVTDSKVCVETREYTFDGKLINRPNSKVLSANDGIYMTIIVEYYNDGTFNVRKVMKNY